MLRARSRRALLGIVLVVALAGAACSDDEGEPAEASTAPSAEPSPSVAATPPATPTPTPTVSRPTRLWLTLEDFTGLTVREAQVTPPQFATAALVELFKGPNQSELSNGWGTAIPRGTRLLNLSITQGHANVDLSKKFESGGGSLSARLRLAQLVYTLTEFQTIQSVGLEIQGRPVTTFSSEGIVIDGPMTRADFEDLMAPIVVETPTAGQRVTSPVRISGNANVFEATVSIEILVGDETAAAAFTTATCGTGCRGTYSKNVRFQVPEEVEAVIRVFESSAQNGAPIHVVSIPVVLVP